MMTTEEVIAKLEAATEPERMHDGYIASLFGWQRKVDLIPKAGSPPGKKITWLSPSGTPGVVPMYTTSIDAALELARALTPSDEWGVTWLGDKGAAVVDGIQCRAATPAMAICLAALRASLAR